MGAAASAVVPVSPELHGYTEGTHAHPEVLRSRRGETLRRQMILKGETKKSRDRLCSAIAP